MRGAAQPDNTFRFVRLMAHERKAGVPPQLKAACESDGGKGLARVKKNHIILGTAT